MMNTINVKIRLFAAFKELIGKSQIDLPLPENSSVRDAVKILEVSYPKIKDILTVSKFAVNLEYQDIEMKLSDGDEITVIMPVSGGILHNVGEGPFKSSEIGNKVLIEIIPDKINTMTVLDFISVPSAGSVLLFNGTVRDNEDGEPVKYLFYEAYKEMAIKEMQKLINKSFSEYELLRIAVIHRVGRINIGDISISIGVSSPHRKDSYLASKFLIDNIKETVPIWKKETLSSLSKWKRI